MKLSVLFAAGAMAALASTAASASTTFVFQNPDADTPDGNFTTGGTCNDINISMQDLCVVDDAAGFDYEVDGVNLNVTAGGDNDPTLLQDLAPRNSGLAVLSDGEGSGDDQVQMDNNESLTFTFGGLGAIFELEEIDFNAGNDVDCSVDPVGSEGGCDQFELVVDGMSLGVFDALDNFDVAAMVGMVVMGRVFEIIAATPGNFGFAIGSITVSQVPVPAALPLLLSGIAGLGFASRRRRKAA